MQRTARPEGLDLPAPQLQRNLSSSNDRTPSISGSSLLSPPPVNPDPAYIAASAASQIVNSDRADGGHTPAGGLAGDGGVDTALVSSGSLVLINTFLDQLLFSFLASSRSTSIAALRPAILEVLKPRLGKEAVDGADEELQGYLSGGDAEELLAFHSGQDFKGEYNLNLIWRRTRLRCMVYTRLGDMEEEDEDAYLEQEQDADGNDGQPRLTRDLGSVSPAAAIFLTSILEFIGEQALLIAGEAAHMRVQAKRASAQSTRARVEEVDMEKVAFNTTLGRLWRSWKKKRVRSSSLLSPRPMSRELLLQRTSSLSQGDSASRKTSTSEDHGSGYFNTTQKSFMARPSNTEGGSSVPVNPENNDNLPEEPDFSDFSTGAPSPETKRLGRGRPRSMIDYKGAPNDSPTRTPTESQSSKAPELRDNEERPTQRRQRSSSLPAKQTPYVSPIEETFTTPNERPDPFVRETDRANAEKEMPKLTDDSRIVPDLGDGDHAVSTMYDGAITRSNEEIPETIVGRHNRDISTYTESSSYTDEYDHELTPQALNLHKSAESSPKQARTSKASGLSSNYSFLAGEQSSSGHPEEGLRGFTGKENEIEEGATRKRNDLMTGHSPDSEPQHVRNSDGDSALQDYPRETHDAKRRIGKRESPVPQEATSNGNNVPISRGMGSADLGNDEVKVQTMVDQQVGGTAHGVPPLSPLRESTDAAHNTSYALTSSASSYDRSKADPFVPSHRPRASGNGSIASSKLSQSQSPMSANIIAEPRSQPSTVNAGAGIEKAAVQRVSPSTRSVTGRTSTSSNRDGRPMTSASTTSQVSTKIKGMIGRDSGDLARQPMPDRNSSESSGSLIRTPNREQDFEELMKSDETVKYTLTPQNMREMETPDSPRYKNNARSETTEMVDSFRDLGPVNGDADRPVTSRSLTKLKGLNGLRSNPTNGTSPTSPISQSSPIENVRAPPKSVPRSPGPHSPGSLARDPTLKSDSVRDFADFIRSTGPPSMPKNLPNPVASNPTRTPRPGSSSSSGAAIGKAPNKIIKQSPVMLPRKPDAQLPKRTTSKLEAREPTISNTNATADLADFFRSGPVGGQIDGPSSSQQSRAAPQLAAGSNGLSNGRMKEAVNSGSSVASTQNSLAASRVTASSTNSKTGLLESSNRAPSASATLKNSNPQRAARSDNPPGPSRKQRRVRDQYALDIDSDNEDGYGTPQAPPEREEESLSDFLRDYRPPPEATTTRPPPIISGPPKSATKQTNPTIRERIARNIAVVPDYRPLPPKNSSKKAPSSSRSPPSKSDEIRKSVRNAEATRRQNSYEGYSPPNQKNVVRGGRSISSTNTNTINNNAPPQLPPLNPSAMSPQFTSQNGTNKDSYPPTQSTYAKPINRGPRKQLQAREESGAFGGGSGRGMSDLADFLRETEPPAPSGPIASANPSARPISPVREKEKTGGAFGRMFGRR